MKHLLPACAALLLAASAAWAQPAAPEEQALQQGLALYRTGEFAPARAAFLKAIELKPGYAAPRFNLAQLAEREERWSEAARWYGEFLRYDQASVYAEIARSRQAQVARYAEADKTPQGQQQRIWLQYLQQAQAQLAAGQAGSALAYAELAGQMMPERFEPKVMLALALMQGERWSEAMAQLDAAAASATGAAKADVEALQARCRDNLAAQERITAADTAFKQAKYAQAAPAYAELWLRLDQSAYGFSAARSWALAGEDERALKIYDQLATSRTAAVAARARREKDALVVRAREAQALKPPVAAPAAATVPDPQAMANAKALLGAQKFYEADARLTQLLDGLLPPPEFAQAFSTRAAARLGMKEYLGAAQDASIAIALDPSLAQAYVQRAEGLAGQGRHAQAVLDLDRAIELTADSAAREALRGQKKRFEEKRESP
jgi:hypothetical protein